MTNPLKNYPCMYELIWQSPSVAVRWRGYLGHNIFGRLSSRRTMSHSGTVASSPWKSPKTDCKKKGDLFSPTGSDVSKSPLRQTRDFSAL